MQRLTEVAGEEKSVEYRMPASSTYQDKYEFQIYLLSKTVIGNDLIIINKELIS